MSELRQNVATKEWVIIAPERFNRPEDLARDRSCAPTLSNGRDDCPFCPGHEERTPPEVDAFRDAQGRWSVRVVANKYPALSREGVLRYQEDGTRLWTTGVGVHDVIIDAPIHDSDVATMELPQVEQLIRMYRRRYAAAAADPRVELVTLFKNHGAAAGASLAHPHSQLIGTPVVPGEVRHRINLAMRYYEDRGRCVHCDMIADELRARERMVCESEHFAAFVLYAALSPFHLWVLPKRHCSFLTELTDDEAADLAQVLRRVLRAIYDGLDDPDYNYQFRCSSGVPRSTPFFHWHLSVVPRVSTSAGFELGSGMYINTVLPERAAAFLRGAIAPG